MMWQKDLFWELNFLNLDFLINQAITVQFFHLGGTLEGCLKNQIMNEWQRI